MKPTTRPGEGLVLARRIQAKPLMRLVPRKGPPTHALRMCCLPAELPRLVVDCPYLFLLAVAEIRGFATPAARLSQRAAPPSPAEIEAYRALG